MVIKIKFDKSATWRTLKHSIKVRRVYRGKNTSAFVRYRDLFEQCYIRVGLLNGSIGKLEAKPIVQPSPTNKKLELVLGRNEWAHKRVLAGPELFKLYSKGSKVFWRDVNKTKYYRSFSATSKNRMSGRIKRTLVMYHRMKKANGLVRSVRATKQPKDWRSYDFPQVLDYFGYQKNLDGAHRRTILHALGHKKVNCLVARLGDVRKEDLKTCVPELYQNWYWFLDEIQRLTGVKHPYREE